MSAAKICPDLSFMYIHGQVNKDLATFFRFCRCLCAVQYVWWLKCDFRFFRITIIRIILSCSYCWTIKIWLTIFLATGKSGELFRGMYFFRTRSLFSATVICFWSIRLLSITYISSFLNVCGPPAYHVFELTIQWCYQSLLTVLRLFGMWLQMPAPWQSRVNLLGGQRCWDVNHISVKIFTH